MNTVNNAPTWLKIVAILALIWNLIGVAAFVNQLTMDLSLLPDPQRDYFESIPLWVNTAFAAAVFGGTLGSIGLFFSKRWAIKAFAISFIGIVLQFSYALFLGRSLEIFGYSAIILPLMTCVVGAALIGLAWVMEQRP